VDRRSVGLGILLPHLFANDIFDSKAYAADTFGNRKAHWSYEFEGQDWTGDCSSGRDQSPIDFSKPNSRPVVDDKAFKISYPKVIDGCTIENNGHGSPQISMPQFLNSSQPESLLFPSVSLYRHTYYLVQIHFHCPSEHSFEGYHGDVEAHFVHADDEGRFLVVAMIMQSNGGKAKLSALSALLQTALEQVPDSPGRADLVNTPIKLHEIMMDGSNQHYYYYKGSLTTPPCSEPVEWIVSPEPQRVSADSVLRLQRLSSSGKTLNFNARRTQSSKGRLVREL
jgi:carbonic anhydrase